MHTTQHVLHKEIQSNHLVDGWVRCSVTSLLFFKDNFVIVCPTCQSFVYNMSETFTKVNGEVYPPVIQFCLFFATEKESNSWTTMGLELLSISFRIHDPHPQPFSVLDCIWLHLLHRSSAVMISSTPASSCASVAQLGMKTPLKCSNHCMSQC